MSELREAIEAAMDTEAPEPVAVEAAPVEVAAEPAVDVNPPDAPEGEVSPKAEGRDEKGRFATKTEGAPKPAIPAAGEQPKAARAAVPPTPGAVAAPAAPGTPEAFRAPQSWKPAAREALGKLPPDLAREILPEIQRREKETAVALQRGAEGTKIADQLHHVMTPFLGMIAAEGSHPLQAIERTMQTGAALRASSPSHVAATMAGIFQEFGTKRFGPQFIEQLAAALDGSAPAQGQHTQAPAGDPRVDQLLARIEQADRQRGQATQQKQAAEVEAFAASHEFFADVKGEMADLLEVASKRGLAMSPKEAYDRAVSFHPEISGVLKQREAAENAKKAQASTTRARAAASSVRSTPAAAVGSAAQPDDVRGAIKAAMAANAGR